MPSRNFGVFWDNILFASKMGDALYKSGVFTWGSIPIELDPGHPPFLATILAIGWTLFGKSLHVSHWLMLPFVFGLLCQINSFVSIFIRDPLARVLAFILVIADPTLLSQLTLINHEIIILFFFLVALNGTLRNNNYQKVIGLAFLGIVSLRGMMLCAGIFMIDIVLHTIIERKSIKHFFTKQTIIGYVLGSMPAIIYLVWRLVAKGWIISNPLEAFGNAWEFSSTLDFWKNFLRNILSLGQQVTDFGRVIPLFFTCFTLLYMRKKLSWTRVTPLIIIAVFSPIVVYTMCILINSSMGHYYFLPSYLSIALLSFILIKEYKPKKFIYVTLLGSLFLGNLIVYPDKFAQGWHSSLAHVPYWNLRKNAIAHMDVHNIPLSETASFFPNNTTIDNVDINGDMRSFNDFTATEEFVFYSNVYNVSDEDLALLDKKYSVVKTFSKQNVRIEILQKNN